jgi:membrane-bound serine protease (ClpP class)
MTALGVSLLVVGSILVVVEAHVPTLGALGAPGVVALASGAVLTVAGLGGGVVVGVLAALLLTAVSAGVLTVSVRKGMATRRRRITAGPEGLIGHVGVVRSWHERAGKVLVDGALWHARRTQGVFEDDDPDDAVPELHPGDHIVVERLSGLTLGVRPAEDWELSP